MLRERAIFLAPHEAGAGGFLAEFHLGKFFRVHHARQRHEKLDAVIHHRAFHAHRAAHAVAHVGNPPAGAVHRVDHRAQILHFLADARILKAPFGVAIARE